MSVIYDRRASPLLRSFVGNELESTASQISKWLVAARGPMSVAKAAAQIGVTEKTLRRWESAENSPNADDLIRAAAVYKRSLAELDALVPVSPDHIVAQILDKGGNLNVSFEDAQELAAIDGGPTKAHLDRFKKALIFEREMIRRGANDAEADTVRFRTRAFLRALRPADYLGLDDEPSNGERMADAEFDSYLEFVLKPLVDIWIHARTSPPIEPIKPKDVAAEVAKRRAEIDRDSKPGRKSK